MLHLNNAFLKKNKWVFITFLIYVNKVTPWMTHERHLQMFCFSIYIYNNSVKCVSLLLYLKALISLYDLFNHFYKCLKNYGWNFSSWMHNYYMVLQNCTIFRFLYIFNLYIDLIIIHHSLINNILVECNSIYHVS